MASRVSVFLDDDAIPRVTTNPGNGRPFETIHIGDLDIFCSGDDAKAVDFWGRLSRAGEEAQSRAQARLDARAAVPADAVIS